MNDACPPLKALLHIMAEGQYESKDLSHPDIRALFTREHLLASDWYQERLAIKQQRDLELARRQVTYLDSFLNSATCCEPDLRVDCEVRLTRAKARLSEVESPTYLESLRGSLGADWIHRAA